MEDDVFNTWDEMGEKEEIDSDDNERDTNAGPTSHRPDERIRLLIFIVVVVVVFVVIAVVDGVVVVVVVVIVVVDIVAVVGIVDGSGTKIGSEFIENP